ncbi:MAG: ABC transporter permease, partial [Desulfobacteraceae bacterium]|nr:ABC transporter permease [Desulfobacteraceae bacterium]
MIKFSPEIKKKIIRFKSIKRGYYSFLIISIMIVFSLFAELFINSRALMVYYNNNFYFPTYQDMIPGKVFGFDYDYETNYRDLKKKYKNSNNNNFVIMPIVPY